MHQLGLLPRGPVLASAFSCEFGDEGQLGDMLAAGGGRGGKNWKRVTPTQQGVGSHAHLGGWIP